MSQRTKALIDLSALQHNLQKIREKAGDRKILAMIKANAYGHGLAKIAKSLLDADAYGVATIEEANEIIKANIEHPTVVMSGFTNRDELNFIDEKKLISVIHHENQIEILEKTKLKNPLKIWLKIDTGMHRLGIDPNDLSSFLLRLNKLTHIQKPIHLMTHLADADNSNQTFTLNQIKLFQQLTKDLPGLKSISNSATIIAYKNYLANVIRPGIMLYGVSPFADRTGNNFQLKPVMSLTSRVIATKKIGRGEKIGYGCTWECPKDTEIAVIAVGYGDGYPRHAKNGTPVLINDVICPLVGRVSMDMITVDIQNAKPVKIGDEAILWGKGLPVEKVAACCDTIGYELLCQVTRRVEFIYSTNF